MQRLKLLAVLFFIFISLTIALSGYPPIAGVTAFLSTLIISIGLFHFLSEVKTRKLGNIKIEQVMFIRNFVFRAYVKIKDVWIVFDKKTKMFRPADFRELPIKAGLMTLIGVVFLYVSYLILSTLTQVAELLFFRTAILVIFLTMGVYNFFLGLARISSLGTENSIRLCKILNKSRTLKSFIERHKIFFEISPNFLLWNGFVTSIEFVLPKKIDTRPIESNFLVQIAKIVEKLK